MDNPGAGRYYLQGKHGSVGRKQGFPRSRGRGLMERKEGCDMPVTALQATKIICQAADWRLSNLHVQKILYLAHMAVLRRTKGSHGIIIGEPFQAWDYGPVIPQIYHKLKIYGAKPVQNIFRSVNIEVVDDEDRKFLESFVHSLDNVSAARLVHATHRPGGAWSKCYQAGGSVPIPNKLIFEEATRLYEAAHI
jgi:uncharacterized phage-associated protein